MEQLPFNANNSNYAANEWYCAVIVPLYLPKTLTYKIPADLYPQILLGCRVEVQVGSKKRYAGIVKEIHQNTPQGFEAKPIIGLLDEKPIVPTEQLKLWSWIAQYYLCSEGEVMIAALPAHLKLSSESWLQYNEEHNIELTSLGDKEYILAEALEIKKELKISEAQKIMEETNVIPTVKRLIEKRICFAWEAMLEKFTEKLETYILLHPNYLNETALETLINSWGKAPKQLDLLLAYLHFQRTEGEVSKPALLQKSGASAAVLEGLVQKNILLSEKRGVDRLPVLAKKIALNLELSAQQQIAYQALQQQLQEKNVCLLHGVTGSGKTLLYFLMMEAVIKKGQQCLYLLPEIALTTQVIRKIRQHFGGYAAVYHSKFNPNERVELWNKVKTGEVQVIVGSRSSLFLPFLQLGLVIVDEEHDSSFKQQEPAPRYNARDAAIYLAALYGAKTILGSATPSLESYYNATQGKFGLVPITERFGSLPLPPLTIIDLKAIPPNEKNGSFFTNAFQTAMQQTLAAGKQIIIFQNRRGYTPYQMCKSCGWIPKCTQCDVSLTYHKSSNRLQCHYCGNQYSLVKACTYCGNNDLTQKNFGTEQLQEILETLLPNVTIGRMDTDSVKGKHSHDTLIEQFEKQKIQVLVGTQMVVKGLDFDHVGMVGIPDGDAILHFADFRVNERAFQLIEQVSGRAGRKGSIGKVMMQLNDCNHSLIPLLQSHNYPAFFKKEMDARKLFDYPPFTRLINIKVRHKDRNTAFQAMDFLVGLIKQKLAKYLTGPASPGIERIRNQYIRECLLKLPKDGKLLQITKTYLQSITIEMQHQPAFKQAMVTIDVDPL